MTAVISHQNNFSTNVASNVGAGETTSPLNSIPSVAAPFYLAFDATNVNGHYEVMYITSKTSTNVNHAALAYAHTTAEEVRMIIPAVEMDGMHQVPQGFMKNGKLSVTVASSNLTVALKTLAGVDPSITDPIFVRIGDTVRIITAALSVTKNAATNWCNAGSAELATKEIDYFAYLGYNSTDGVVLGFSRIPYANCYSDFSATTTNEKYCAISTITTAAATDYYEVIGRFAATLSATAAFTWSVPTFTASNLIQRPIYETRKLSYTSQITGFSAATIQAGVYKVIGSNCFIEDVDITGTSNATGATLTVPFAVTATARWIPARITDNGTVATAPGMVQAAAPGVTMTAYKDWSGTVFTNSGAKIVQFAQVFYSLT